MSNETDRAIAQITNLEDQIEELLARQTKIDAERKNLAFAAHAEQNAKAKEKLRALNDKSVALTGELKSVGDALVEAKLRLGNAQSSADRAASAARAEQAAALLAKLREELENANDAFADAIGSVLDAKELLTQLHALDIAYPIDQQFKISVVIAIKSVIQNLPSPYINDFEFARLAPGQKKTFKNLADAWCPTIANQIAARLPADKKEDAA